MARAKRSRTADSDDELGGFIDFKTREFRFSEKQETILKTMLDKDTKMVFLSGVAGSSKSYLSLYAALHLLNGGAGNQIIYIRSLVESSSKSMGYLPGGENEKFQPYMLPLLEKGEEIVQDKCFQSLVDGHRIVAMPINFLRGASWKDKIIIVDESQNLDKKETELLLTRLGEGSRIFLCGDQYQSDINGKSGFNDFIQVFSTEDCREKGIFHFDFGKEDIFRSEILKFIVAKIEIIKENAKKKL